MPMHVSASPVRLGSVVFYWWQALSSGRFFSRWTVLAFGIVSIVVLSPVAGLKGLEAHLGAMAASFLAWVLLVVALSPVAFAERRIRSRVVRGVLVIVALLAASFARPFLNDVIANSVFGHEVTGTWIQRVATNTLTWFTLLPLVAAATQWYGQARRSAARLSSALAVFDDLRHRISRYSHENTQLLDEAIEGLRGRREALLGGQIDFDAVRRFAEEVRETSHRLDERLGVALDYRTGYAVQASPSTPPEPWLARLSPPPALLVVALYFVASIPYTYVAGGRLLLAAALALLLVLGLIADAVIRALSRGRSAAAQGAVIVATWTIVGLIMTAAGMMARAGDGPVLAVPLLVIPALAVVIAFGMDALRRSRADGDALTSLLTSTSSLATARIARAREPLWRAVDLLHDRVQSRCVIFAARVDENEPSPAEIERFRAETDDAFGAILAGSSPYLHESRDLDGLLATWAGVLDVRAEIDAPAAIALQSADVSASVVAAVGEGLINAVKHSSAREARVTITTADDGSSLTVEIASAGSLGRGATGLGLASLGGRAQLLQVGDEVVLRVLVPLSEGALAGDAPSRRWSPPASGVQQV